MINTFGFKPISFSWVALHPKPKGVIMFMGGAFFGSFPTLFYRYFLKELFEAGYTIVALPFRFSFRHWSLSIALLKEQEVIQKELIQSALYRGYECELYQEKSSYFWIGHSLGCKYIALLEFLSGDRWRQILHECSDQQNLQQVEELVNSLKTEKPSIKGQSSLLIAPDISDTSSAIPIPFLAQFLDQLGLGVLPTRKQTQCFVEHSRLFNLTALISFDKDDLAGSKTDGQKDEVQKQNSDVIWLIEQLRYRQLPILYQEILGQHLEPIGIRVGSYIVDLNPFDKFIKPIKNRLLEVFAIQFLKELKKREEFLSSSAHNSIVSSFQAIAEDKQERPLLKNG